MVSRSVHGWRWALVAAAVIAMTVVPSGPTAAAPPRSLAAMASCLGESGAAPSGNATSPALRMVLDERGWLAGYDLTLAGGLSYRLGRIAFLDGPFGDWWLLGESRGGTSVVRLYDARRRCVAGSFSQAGLIFSAAIDPTGSVLVHDLVAQRGREQLGVWRRSLSDLSRPSRVLPGVPSSDPLAPVWINTFAWGPEGSLAAQSCGASQCVTQILSASGDVRSQRSREQGVLRELTAAGLLVEDGSCHALRCPTVLLPPDPEEPPQYDVPLVDPRPVPESESDTWAKDRILEYRWGASAPPSWMRPAIQDAASDVTASRASRAARFTYDPAGAGYVQLAETMSGNCERAIACATRDIPNYWRIALRPHGVRAGSVTTRWCQAYDSPPEGCFDVSRTLLHEFGHVEGLAHPDDHGFRLAALETVMHPVIPGKGRAGWQLHRFGQCDAARLQRRYGRTSPGADLALCDRVETRLTIEASDSSVAYQERVTVTARLHIRDQGGYGQLGGDPLSGRNVAIQRRVPGGSWISFDASRGDIAGEYQVTFQPWTTYEYRAVFDRPSSEGLSADVSDILTVRVAPCTSNCAEAATTGPTSRSD